MKPEKGAVNLHRDFEQVREVTVEFYLFYILQVKIQHVVLKIINLKVLNWLLFYFHVELTNNQSLKRSKSHFLVIKFQL